MEALKRGRIGMLALLPLAFAGLPFEIAAQSKARGPTVAVLEPSSRTFHGFCLPAFRAGMRDLGYIEGKNVAVHYHFADAKPERLSPIAAEIVRLKPDVIWTHSPAAAQALKRATTSIPIVVGVSTDLVEAGLVAGLARPGGNLTGFELRDNELLGKRLELLKEAVPSVTRVAILVDAGTRAHDDVARAAAPHAQKLRIHVRRIETDSPEKFEGAFSAMTQWGADALLVTDVPFTARNRDRLMELALKHRLPTVSGWRIFGEAGSLISYGANVVDLCRRSVAYVDRILKGASAGELPVQRPEKLELLVNLKTARMLGLTMPAPLLLRADERIE